MTNLLTRDLTASPDEPTPIDVWLRQQQDLSAVERFSAHHDEFSDHGVTLPEGRWRDRLPATAPGPGQQYAFEVDLDSCTGCKACVAACHSLNGLDEGEAWRRVGSLHDAGSTGGSGCGAPAGGNVTVTSACHHCVDPACMNGCPAKAYEKDPVTGIVRHLDDACIGCSYCTLTCPYEVPVFNQSLGIVRKCDMCSDRLAEGDAPACVQGCPQGAIAITLTSTADLVASFRSSTSDPHTALVPTSPRSNLTVPSTVYRSTKPVPTTWVAADRSSIHPSHGHTPLAVMLVLTQAAVGMTLAAAGLRASSDLSPTSISALATIGLVTGLVAIAASTLHLGRPLLAWRAILGLRRSWLSREIAAFGLFACAGVSHAGLQLLGAPSTLVDAAELGAVAGGLAGIGCSVQLYAVTGRRWWRFPTTAARFAGTTIGVGAAGTASVVSLVDPTVSGPLVRLLIPLAAFGISISALSPLVPLWLSPHRSRPSPSLAATSRLLGHQLRTRLLVRLAGAALGLALLVVASTTLSTLTSDSLHTGLWLVAATGAALGGEYHDRRLFFLASVAPRMPGSPR